MKLAFAFMLLTVSALVIAGLMAIYGDVNLNGQFYSYSKHQTSHGLFHAATKRKSYPNKAYVVLFGTPGQQGSGLRALSVFQCVLGSIYNNFYIVEPCIQNSNLRGISRGGTTGLKFSVLFDFDAFNLESRKTGYPEMVTMDEFVESSTTHIIYVNVGAHRNSQRIVWARKKSKKSCFESTEYWRAQKDTAKLKSEFCIVRVIQLPILRLATDQQNISGVVQSSTNPREGIYNFIFGEWLPEEVTLVFSVWSSKLYLPVEAPLHETDCARSYAEYEPKMQFKPSKRLMKDAKKYEDMFLGGQNKLAVMLRVERAVRGYLEEAETQANASKPKNLEECFQEVLRLKETNLSVGLKPMVTLDIGRFGSGTVNTLDETAKLQSRRTLMALYDNKWTVAEWEKSFTQMTNRSTDDRSYVAALQKTLASRADCLILMGGGSFQALAVQDYFDYHRNSEKKRCIELVCTMTHNSEVQKTLLYSIDRKST